MVHTIARIKSLYYTGNNRMLPCLILKSWDLIFIRDSVMALIWLGDCSFMEEILQLVEEEKHCFRHSPFNDSYLNLVRDWTVKWSPWNKLGSDSALSLRSLCGTYIIFLQTAHVYTTGAVPLSLPPAQYPPHLFLLVCSTLEMYHWKPLRVGFPSDTQNPSLGSAWDHLLGMTPKQLSWSIRPGTGG